MNHRTPVAGTTGHHRGHRRGRRAAPPLSAPLNFSSPCDRPGGKDHGRQDEHPLRGRRKGPDGRPALVREERGAGRPLRVRENHARRGSRPHGGGAEPGGAGRGRCHGLRLRRDRAPAGPLRAALTRSAGMGRIQDQSAGHPRLRGLRRGTQGRSASGGRGPFHCLGCPGAGGGGRGHPGRVGGMRGGRHAEGDRRHPSRHGAHRLRRDDQGLRTDLRRGRPGRRAAALSAGVRRGGAGRPRSGHRTGRAAVPERPRLLVR